MTDRRTKAASLADIAYARVRETALAFPAAEEKLSHGAPSFHVRGKMFLIFVDDHHGDGRVAVWCRSLHDEQRRLVATDPQRFFVPPYVGVKGWLGIRVDGPDVDWIDLAILVEEGWRSVAPPRIVRGEDLPPRKAVLPPSPRIATDPEVSRAALDRLAGTCMALPDAALERDSRHATFRVRKKVFAYFFDHHHGETVAACVREEKPVIASLLREHPERFFLPAYIGTRGWVGIRLAVGRVDWKDVARRVEASYRRVAPRPPRRDKGDSRVR